MMTNRRPGDVTLTVNVTMTNEAYSLEFCGYGKKRSFKLKNIAFVDELKHLRGFMSRELADFKDMLDGRLQLEEAEFDLLNSALSSLQTAGQHALGLLLGKEASRSRDLKRYAIASLHNWRARKRNATPVVRLNVPSIHAAIPIEVMPLFETKRLQPAKHYRDLLLITSRFVGFHAITFRVVRGLPSVSKNRWLQNVPKLPVKIFHHAAELAGSAIEVDYFRRTDAIDVDGPWPDESTESALTEKTAIAALF